MAGRVARLRRGAGAALAGLAAIALSACGLKAPARAQLTPSPSPSPAPTSASPTASPAPSGTPSATAKPATASPSPTPTPSRTPSRTPAPTPTPTPTSTATPSPYVVVGRPLRQRRRLLRPDVGRGIAPVHPDHRRLGALPGPLRTDLAALWLGAARSEHASVPAFAEVALLLGAVGAPLDLVAAAHRAALDEVEHTRVSYALANAYGATTHAPGALPRLLGRRLGPRRRRRTAALRRLAVEALRDGCLNEGYAAGLAAAGAARATDPAARHALDRIAGDEAGHTELSWRLLGWSLDAGGPPVRAAVARTLRSLPSTAPAPTPRADLEAHGWPSPATAAEVYAAVRAGVVDRAAGLLSLSDPATRRTTV